MFEYVDPFIGTDATDLPPPQGLAATWWWPKPQVGNTHPGATYPFGMVSACAYSGAYPTGYGPVRAEHRGRAAADVRRSQSPPASRHFQQSGTGAIRKYYNYFRVTPMLEPLDDLGTQLGADRRGRRARLLRGHARLGHPLRAHRRAEERRPPLHVPAPPRRADRHRLLARRPGSSRTARRSRCGPTSRRSSPGVAQGEIVVEGAPLAVHLECDARTGARCSGTTGG